MPTVCHVLDASAGWEQRYAVSVLRDRLETPAFEQLTVSLGASHVPQTETLHPWGPIEALAAPSLRRFWQRQSVEVVQAWGVAAAAAVRASTDRALVVELFDPAEVRRRIMRIRAIDERGATAWICPTGIVRRRLIEGGIAPDRCVLIRPAVDFSTVNRVRRGTLRDELGIPRDHTLIAVPEPVTRESGAFEGFAAAALVNHLRRDLHFVLAGSSPEANRVARFATTLPSRPTLLRTFEDRPFVELLCIADALLIPAKDDVSATSIAWAMAGGAVVIGSAVPSIAELIAHKVNGLLFNPKTDCGPIVSIARLLNDTESYPRLREAARGQAYEVFGVRRNVEQHAGVYENLLRGAPPSEGIIDSAQVA